MNKLLPFLAITLLLNCSQKNEKTDHQRTLKNDSLKNSESIADTENTIQNPADERLDEMQKVEYAKSIIDQTNELVKKGILKQMNSSEVNEKINPLMLKYDSIISELSKEEMKELEIYRTKELNKTIDLQVENR